MKTLEQRIRDLEAKMQTAVRYAPGGGAVSAARLTVGNGATIGQIAVYAANITPAAVSANSVVVQTFTVNGLATNDKVFLNWPLAVAGIAIAGLKVPSANTLEITFANVATVTNTPAPGAYQIVAIRT